MKRRHILFGTIVSFSILLFIAQQGVAMDKAEALGEKQQAEGVENYLELPLHFIKNEGQVDRKVAFYEKGSGHSTFFTEKGIFMTIDDGEHASHMKLTLLNANKKPEIVGENRLEGKVHYFIGNDKKKWKTDISTYSAVRYKDIYENIDIKFYGNNRQLEYDIVLRPGSDLSAVKFLYKGIEELEVTDKGDLSVSIKGKHIIHKKPYIYQEIDGKRIEIEGAYKIFNKNSFGFQVASYNRDYPIVIDPVIVYSTYLGGSFTDFCEGIVIDGSGNMIIAGSTFSTDFPTQNPLQPGYSGSYDVFVTKINTAGDALVYSTYLGGSNSDNGYGIAVDSSDNVYLTGATQSTDFPTQNPLQPNYAGDCDLFVTKINAAGSALVYSTYLGGSDYDSGWKIAIDGSGNAYCTGSTESTDFPTHNPIQPSYGGGNYDVFVTKINAAGSALVYSTYLGGSFTEICRGIAVDSSGNAYVTGETESYNFPTQNPLQPSKAGAYDLYVTKINTAGDALVYSTYLGGSTSEGSTGIAVDSSGNAYVTGETLSTNFPTKNPLQPNLKGDWDAFVTKINTAGDGLVYSTYLGGSDYDRCLGIAVDSSGNAYVTGYTNSTDFPTQNPLQPSNAGYYDAFVTKINMAGSVLVYSTYLGGTSLERGQSVAVDNTGNAYVAGYTDSNDFPTKNPLQPNFNGAFDAFVTKIGIDLPFSVPRLLRIRR